jgi:hypothetical protein
MNCHAGPPAGEAPDPETFFFHFLLDRQPYQSYGDAQLTPKLYHGAAWAIGEFPYLSPSESIA